MAVDGIEGQSWRIRSLTHVLSMGQKSQLDQSLETVADAKYQSVPFLQQIVHCLFDLLILECCRKKFGRTIRLITGRKTAREHDDLRLRDGFFKDVHRLPDITLA